MIYKTYFIAKKKNSTSYLYLDAQYRSWNWGDFEQAYKFDSEEDVYTNLVGSNVLLFNTEICKIVVCEENEIKDRKDHTFIFANKIKNHMMKYCRARLEQQYCAMEVIDFIDTLLGENSISFIDVEKEWADADDNAILDFLDFINANNYIEPDFTIMELFLNYKEEKKDNKKFNHNITKAYKDSLKYSNKSPLKSVKDVLGKVAECDSVSTPKLCTNDKECTIKDSNICNELIEFSKWCYMNGIDFSHMSTSEEIKSGVPFIYRVLLSYKEYKEKNKNDR